MSHFVKINLKIDNIEVLRRAVEALGYTLIKGGVARGAGTRMQADYVIRLRGPYDVAVVRQGEYYTLETDLWRGEVERELGKGLAKLKQEYARQYAFVIAQERGYEVANMIEQGGEIEIELVERW